MTARSVSELVVHDDAVRANTAFFAERISGRLMAVLKADAFGHGAVARTVVAAGARSIGVTSIAEALAVRAEGVVVPVLSWLNPVDADFGAAVLADVDMAVPSTAVLAAVAHAGRVVGRRARVHLHVDVGMARDGCPPGAWAALCALACEFEAAGDIRVVGVMGHMSSADLPEDRQNDRERLVFRNAVRTARRRSLRPAVTHLAATAATLTGVGDGHDLHRIGAGLFGIDPSGTTDVLRPALTLRTRVVATRTVPAGTGVGYGHDHTAAHCTTLALLPLGYGDGLPRAAAHRAEVLLAGRRRPVVGRFSMDMLVVDTGGDDVLPGSVATVFGPGGDGEPTVAEWAGWASTIPHEIVVAVGARSARVLRTTTTTTTGGTAWTA